ncbi:glycosyltransferase family 39 protein [Sphingomonas sp. PB2P12]|uniref:ArnT family glycosyltransferase n=1 Tax=Sphingomonas sandaracina TaxID=3096157 RepID=UPI002FC6B00B
MTNRGAVTRTIALAPLLGLAALALAALTGGLSASFIDPDESSHYVNTLFIGDWLRAGLPSPMTFAQGFYAHFPKLSIGHWPPGWYALIAPLFAILRPSAFGAAILSAFIAGLPASLVGWGLFRAGTPRLAIAAAFAVLLLPLEAESARYFLLDQPVTLVVGLAAIAWLAAADRPSWSRLALFSALAVFSTLVKGNGLLVALVPAIDIVLSWRWPLLRDRKLWIAGAITGLLILPWYLISFKISAGGFNYAPGLAYAWDSLVANLRAVHANLGWSGIFLVVIGTIKGWQDPRSGAVVRLSVSVILATLIFQAAIPVALVDRYILPLLPWCAILAALGVQALWTLAAVYRAAAVACTVATLAIPAVALAHLPAKPDLGAPAIARTIIDTPGIWLVDGRAGGEGAVIAAAAYADGGQRRIWVARASQWLSTSDFMGRGYVLTARTPSEARATLDQLGIRGVVIVGERMRFAYPHSVVLANAVRTPDYSQRQTSFPVGLGATSVAVRAGPITPRPDLLATGSGSHNFSTMTGAD